MGEGLSALSRDGNCCPLWVCCGAEACHCVLKVKKGWVGSLYPQEGDEEGYMLLDSLQP